VQEFLFYALALGSWIFFEFLKGRTTKKSPKEQEEVKNEGSSLDPVTLPYEVIREEIKKKKEARRLLEETDRTDTSTNLEEIHEAVIEPEVKPNTQFESASNTSFYSELEQQEKEIAQKQKEAEMLKAQVQFQVNEKVLAKKQIQSSDRITSRIRRNFKTKTQAQIALISGDILSKPIALRGNDLN